MAPDKEKLKKSFAAFDTDGSGALTHEELKAALTRPGGGAPMSDEDVAKLIKEFDANGDGVIQVEEFVAMMTGCIEPETAWYMSIDKAPVHSTMCPPKGSVDPGRDAFSDPDAMDLSGTQPGGFRLTCRITTTVDRGLILAKCVEVPKGSLGVAVRPEASDLPDAYISDLPCCGSKILAVYGGRAYLRVHWCGGCLELHSTTPVNDGSEHTVGFRFYGGQYHLFVDGKREAAGYCHGSWNEPVGVYWDPATGGVPDAHAGMPHWQKAARQLKEKNGNQDVPLKTKIVFGDAGKSVHDPLVYLRSDEARACMDGGRPWLAEIRDPEKGRLAAQKSQTWQGLGGTLSHVTYASGQELLGFPDPPTPILASEGDGQPTAVWPSADEAFAALDTDKSGTLSTAELEAYFAKRGHAKEEIGAILTSLDGVGGDGVVTKEEWRSGFYKSYPVLTGMVALPNPDWRDLHYNGRGCTIKDTEKRAMRISQMHDLRCHITRRCEAEGWTNFGGTLLTPGQVTLYDACRYVIKPMTAARRASYVEIVALTEQRPKWFVSHWWGEPVLTFIKCVAQHAFSRGEITGLKCEGDWRHSLKAKAGPPTELAAYWVCAYANNQWDLGSSVTSDPSQTSFYKAIGLSKGTVTVLDHDAITFTRIWCSFEIYTSIKEGGPKFIYDIVSLMPDDKTVVAIQDKNGGHCTDIDQMPLEVSKRVMEMVACESAQASMEADRVHILNRIHLGGRSTLKRRKHANRTSQVLGTCTDSS